MTIKGTYNKANAHIEISLNNQLVFSVPRAYLHSKGEISLHKIKAAPNTHFDIIKDPQRQKNAVFSKLDLF